MTFQRAVTETFETWWNELAIKINKAVVFLDAAAAECLHWHSGLLWLLKFGALNVKELSSFQVGRKNQNKAVFILSTPVYGQPLNIIKDIITSSNFNHCLVITSAPPDVHALLKHSTFVVDDKHSFYSLEEKLIEWMGNMSCSAEVLYIPIFAASICPWLFIMPSFSDVFPLCFEKLAQSYTSASTKRASSNEGGFASLPDTLKLNIKHLVYCLNSLFAQLNVKEDIFSLGYLSHIVGNELENLICARNRRKSASRKASLLLVDRTLDLAGPLSQDTDVLLDRVLRVLPHLHGHTCDVAVDMTSLSTCKGGLVFNSPVVAPGCLAHKQNAVSHTLIEEFVMSKQKECFMELNRKVVEVSIKEGLPVEMTSRTGRLTPEQLEKRTMAFREKPEALMKNISLLQQALAVVQTYQHPSNNKLDELLSTEKLLLQNMVTSKESVSQNILQIISHRKERKQTLEDIVILISFLFAIGGGNILLEKETKAELQAALVEAIFEDVEELPLLLKNIVGESVDETSVILAIRRIFVKLEAIGSCRDNLKKYRSLYYTANPALPTIYTPLLKQVVEDIFKPTVTEIVDIEYHSSGFKDLLKSGFSLFMNVSKTFPCDNPLLIIIVLGGITATEVKQIKESASSFKSVEVIIGATRLLTPVDTVHKIFCDISYEDKC